MSSTGRTEDLPARPVLRAVRLRFIGTMRRSCSKVVLTGVATAVVVCGFGPQAAYARHHKRGHHHAARERSYEQPVAASYAGRAQAAYGIGRLSGFFTQGIGGATTAAPYFQGPSLFDRADPDYIDPRYGFPGEQ